MTDTPRRTGRPTLKEAQTLRRRVMDEALALLRVTGIERLSMEEVARQAGVTKRTIYRQFGSKAELVDAVVDQEIRQLHDIPVEWTGLPCPIDALRSWARSFFDYMVKTENTKFVNYLCFEAIDDACLREKVASWHALSMDIPCKLIVEAQRQRQLPQVPADRLAALLVDLLNGSVDRRRKHLDEPEIFLGQGQDEHFQSRWICFLAAANSEAWVAANG